MISELYQDNQQLPQDVLSQGYESQQERFEPESHPSSDQSTTTKHTRNPGRSFSVLRMLQSGTSFVRE